MKKAKGIKDQRLVGHRYNAYIINLADIQIPETCTGISMIKDLKRKTLYESQEGVTATRMITDCKHKLIWYPAGNRWQLFDLNNDPMKEMIYQIISHINKK